MTICLEAIRDNNHVLTNLRDIPSFLLRPSYLFQNYNRGNLQPDVIAGLTVAVVLLPQAIAYALIAELPPQAGLCAAIVAAIIGRIMGVFKPPADRADQRHLASDLIYSIDPNSLRHRSISYYGRANGRSRRYFSIDYGVGPLGVPLSLYVGVGGAVQEPLICCITKVMIMWPYFEAVC